MTHHIENINDILALHFANEQLTEEQEEVLMGWMIENKDEYHQLSRLMASGQFDTREAWNRVQARLTQAEKPRASRFWVKQILSVAACLLLVAGVSLYFFNRTEDNGLLYTNECATLEHVLLPDSSTVVLYPGSTMRYLAEGAERKVTLEGKAFFKVYRDEKSPFTVSSHQTEIKVLGTSFLVSNRIENETEVFVREGLVQVAAASNKVLLHANEQATVTGMDIDKGQIELPEIVFEEHLTRKTYQDAPLAEVVRDIEQELKVEIEVAPSLLNSRINATVIFVQIDEILGELSYICDCKYEKISDRKYKLVKP